jgi:hypothetical protein
MAIATLSLWLPAGEHEGGITATDPRLNGLVDAGGQ